MSRSYAKFWRDLDAAGLTRKHKACALYCHLLCAASVTARRLVFNGVTVNVKPGQVVTSRGELSSLLGLTDKEVRGAIKTLEKLQLVGQQGASKYTLITLIDSDSCNNEEPTEGQQKGQVRAKSGPAEGPDEGQLLYKVEECRRKNEECISMRGKNFSSPPPMNGEDIEEAKVEIARDRQRGDYEFNLLRSEYDRARPEGPQAGRAEFMALFHSQAWPGLDELLAGLNRLLEGDYQFLDKTYTPGLAKFLSQQMWKMKPRKPQPKPGQEPELTDEEKAAKEKAARMLAELKTREAAKKKIRGW